MEVKGRFGRCMHVGFGGYLEVLGNYNLSVNGALQPIRTISGNCGAHLLPFGHQKQVNYWTKTILHTVGVQAGFVGLRSWIFSQRGLLGPPKPEALHPKSLNPKPQGVAKNVFEVVDLEAQRDRLRQLICSMPKTRRGFKETRHAQEVLNILNWGIYCPVIMLWILNMI